jgi:hypothetical protein
MNHSSGFYTFRQILLACLCLGAVHQLAIWPGPQAAVHAFLVLGLAPEFRSMLVSGLWAAAAGWVMEGSLRNYPHLGGTALANIPFCLIAAWLLLRWPPNRRLTFLGRMGILCLLHSLAVHLAVYLAGGRHAWGWGWLWSLLLVPLWGTLSMRLHRPFHRR